MTDNSNAPVNIIAPDFNSSYWFLVVTTITFIARVISIPNGILDKTDQAFNSIEYKIITIMYIFIVIMVMVYFNT